MRFVTKQNVFGPQRRLRRTVEYRKLFAGHQKKARARYFTAYWRTNTAGHARLGLIIAKRQARLAVSRSRIKRICREAFRQQANLPAVDVVLRLSRPVDKKFPFELLRSDINVLLEDLS